MSSGMRILRRVAGTLLAIGAIGWFGGFALAMGLSRWIPSSVQLPLGGIGSVAVDDAGRIYCAAQAYARVQVYDRSGAFIRGWYVDVGRGSFAVAVDADGLVHVGTARKDKHFVFDQQGHLIRQEVDSEYYQRLSDEGTTVRDGAGNRYMVSSSLLCPRVVRVTPAGEEHTVVSMPIHLWFLMAPFPAWLFVAIGIIVLSVTDRFVRDKGQQG